MPRYKLAAFDMDDTMLLQDASLSDYAAEVLRAIDKKGVKLVPCTGRPYTGAIRHLQKIGVDSIGVFCNGAQIRGTLSGEIMDECPMSLDDALLVVDVGLEAGGHPRVYINDLVYVTHIIKEDVPYMERTGVVIEPVGDLRSFMTEPPLKILHKMPSAEYIPPLYEKSSQIFGDRLHIVQSHSTYLEYTHSGATKGKGLKKLAALWGVSKNDIVVAGDHQNDLTMFQEAGFSIAPQNAQPAVRQAASCVCQSNAEDGVARKLAEIFGIKI